MIGACVFAVCSGLNILFSWRWLGNPRHHGFFRFFAFEALCGLILVQSSDWFTNPFSFRQLLSWALLACSLALALHGVALLHRYGHARVDFEQTTVLVMKGAFRYVRHPMYGSLLLLAFGALLKSISLVSTGLAVLAALSLVLTALTEEQENLTRFGPSYAAYRQRTRMFIPWIF